jgi:hypothetical protein
MTAPSMNNRMRCLGYLSANVSRKIRKHFVSGAGIIRWTQVPSLGDVAIQVDAFAKLAGHSAASFHWEPSTVAGGSSSHRSIPGPGSSWAA